MQSEALQLEERELLRRGYGAHSGRRRGWPHDNWTCCGSNSRLCPFPNKTQQSPRKPTISPTAKKVVPKSSSEGLPPHQIGKSSSRSVPSAGGSLASPRQSLRLDGSKWGLGVGRSQAAAPRGGQGENSGLPPPSSQGRKQTQSLSEEPANSLKVKDATVPHAQCRPPSVPVHRRNPSSTPTTVQPAVGYATHSITETSTAMVAQERVIENRSLPSQLSDSDPPSHRDISAAPSPPVPQLSDTEPKRPSSSTRDGAAVDTSSKNYHRSRSANGRMQQQGRYSRWENQQSQQSVTGGNDDTNNFNHMDAENLNLSARDYRKVRKLGGFFGSACNNTDIVVFLFSSYFLQD